MTSDSPHSTRSLTSQTDEISRGMRRAEAMPSSRGKENGRACQKQRVPIFERWKTSLKAGDFEERNC